MKCVWNHGRARRAEENGECEGGFHCEEDGDDGLSDGPGGRKWVLWRKSEMYANKMTTCR